MGWLDSTLGYTVRNQEEIELAVNNFRLFNETLVDVGTLRWVLNVVVVCHVEESLSHSLVNNDQSVLWKNGFLDFFSVYKGVFLGDNLVQLFKFMSDNLLSH